MTGSTPVLSLPQAGNLVVQTGLGSGSPSYVVTNGTDGSTTDAELAVDAATRRGRGELAVGRAQPELYLQGVAPAVGAPQPVPGQSRNALVLAGARHGPRRLRRVHDRRQARAPAPLRRRHGRGRLTQPAPPQRCSASPPASRAASG